jgi:predicted protein tyrosine phosphatase
MSNKKIIFVCTSNESRSIALEKYFGEVYPNNEYRSAGINKFYCEKKGTRLITDDDIEWCDILVFAEDVHLKVVKERFNARTTNIGSIIFSEKHSKEYTVLNCGDYQQGCIGEDYLTKAEEKIKRIIFNN